MIANIFCFCLLIIIFASNLMAMEKKYNNMTNNKQEINFSFKNISEEDIPLLYSWLKEPHVSKWWPTPEKDEFYEKFLQRIRSKDTVGYLVLFNSKPIGYIQYYKIDRSLEKAGSWLPELPENTVGTDQFIGDKDFIGKGYGTLFVKEFIKYLKNLEPELTTVIVDPEPDNIAAIRCYEKVGFKNVGLYDTAHGKAQLLRYDIK